MLYLPTYRVLDPDLAERVLNDYGMCKDYEDQIETLLQSMASDRGTAQSEA